MVTLAQRIKFKKICRKRFYKHIRVVLFKNLLEKTTNLREMRPFWKSAIMQYKGYSLCKMLGLAQKLKFQKNMQKTILKHITVVLCKKPHKKTNIREIRPFWKSPIMQCQGYSLWKMLSLAQKLKLKKTSRNRFYKHIRVVVWKKKPLKKTTNIQEIGPFW